MTTDADGSLAETEPLWERVKNRGSDLGSEREAALACARQLTRSPQARAREEAAVFLAQVGDAEAHEELLAMLLTENNYALAEKVVTLLATQGEARDGARALRIAQAQPELAASFAYRRIARAIGDRLALTEVQLRGAVPDAEMELFLRRMASDGRATGASASGSASTVPKSAAARTGALGTPQTPVTLGTPQTPATLGTPQTPVTLGTPQTPGFRIGNGLALALLVALVSTAAGLAVWPKLNQLTEAAGERVSTVTPQALASSNAPASFTHARVSWEGVVESVQAPAQTLHVKTEGGALVIAIFDALPDLRAGERVRFSGKITGRSRFGPIHMRGLTVERTAP